VVGIWEDKEEPCKIADGGGKSLEEAEKKGAVTTYKQLHREKIVARKLLLQDFSAGQIHIGIRDSFLTGRWISPGNKLWSKMGNAPPLDVYG